MALRGDGSVQELRIPKKGNADNIRPTVPSCAGRRSGLGRSKSLRREQGWRHRYKGSEPNSRKLYYTVLWMKTELHTLSTLFRIADKMELNTLVDARYAARQTLTRLSAASQTRRCAPGMQ